MTRHANLDPSGDTDQAALVADRRRPGRRAQVNENLVQLLRGEAPAGEPLKLTSFDEADQLAGMRGIMVGALLSAPLWLGLYFAAEWIVR